MNEEKQEVYKILELGTDEKNLHKHKNTGGLLYIDLSMIKFSNLSTYIRKQDKEIERLNNIINELEKWLKEEQDRLARENSHIYEDSLGKTRLVNKDIFNEVTKIKSKLQELKGDNKE